MIKMSYSPWARRTFRGEVIYRLSNLAFLNDYIQIKLDDITYFTFLMKEIFQESEPVNQKNCD